jgi:ubiquinol-cytochrome c reductase cytochrome c subunit
MGRVRVAQLAGPGALVLGLGLAATLGLTRTAHAQTAGQPDPAVIARGQVLYTEQCSSCHQADGTGQAASGIPSVHGVGAAAVDFYLSTGRMPEATLARQAPRKPPSVSPADRAALVAYVTTTWPGGPDLPALAPGSFQAGSDLFRANCAACHGASGAGAALAYGAFAPSLRPANLLQVAEAIRVGPGNMPVFDPRTLSDAQVADVDAYVQYLHHPDDRGGAGLGHTGPVAEGFVALLFGMGGALLVATWTGHRTDNSPKERTRA